MKRFFCALLVLCMLLGQLPAFAADGMIVSTPVTIGGSDYMTNLTRACAAMNGQFVDTDHYLSFNNTLGPRSKETGYKDAINGRGAKVIGGGVSQVATTLYLALQTYCNVVFADLDFYGDRFTAGYCEPDDAVITDYKAGHDLKFYNVGEPFTIYMWCDADNVYCEIARGGSASQQPSSSDSPCVYTGRYIVDVSSYRENNSAGSVDGYCAVDGDTRTAWNTNNSTQGEYIHLEPIDLGQDYIIGIRVMSGYAKNETVYKSNARPKELEIWLGDGQEGVFVLQDSSQWQTFMFDRPINAPILSLYINSVYAGSRYNDCCITEIELLLAD